MIALSVSDVQLQASPGCPSHFVEVYLHAQMGVCGYSGDDARMPEVVGMVRLFEFR